MVKPHLYLKKKIQKLAWWHSPVVPVTWEAETGGRQSLQWAKFTLLHSSLGDRVALCPKRKKSIYVCIQKTSSQYRYLEITKVHRWLQRWYWEVVVTRYPVASVPHGYILYDYSKTRNVMLVVIGGALQAGDTAVNKMQNSALPLWDLYSRYFGGGE